MNLESALCYIKQTNILIEVLVGMRVKIILKELIFCCKGKVWGLVGLFFTISESFRRKILFELFSSGREGRNFAWSCDISWEILISSDNFVSVTRQPVSIFLPILHQSLQYVEKCPPSPHDTPNHVMGGNAWQHCHIGNIMNFFTLPGSSSQKSNIKQ